MSLNPKHFRVILMRELQNLRKEVEAYPNEASLWKKLPNTSNSGGNLAVHLIGNLNAYLGRALAGKEYQRSKEKEFSVQSILKEDILDDIDQLLQVIPEWVDPLPAEVLEGIFPEELEGKQFPTELILHHVMAHFAYHLGQINYHRRALEIAH